LHWHTADEWAIMLDGNARVTVMNPDGTMFIDDVSKGDLWLFPAGFPHSIQGLRPNGCEFLLVFDEGDFAEDGTFLLSETVAHTPRNMLAKNFRLDKEVIAKLVRKEELYIFPADLPLSLAQDKASIGGQRVESPIKYTFKMDAMNPHSENTGRRGSYCGLAQFPCFQERRGGARYSQARRLARTALAPQCQRVAVLASRQRTHDHNHE
jgi:oxalate decarboxylase